MVVSVVIFSPTSFQVSGRTAVLKFRPGSIGIVDLPVDVDMACSGDDTDIGRVCCDWCTRLGERWSSEPVFSESCVEDSCDCLDFNWRIVLA